MSGGLFAIVELAVMVGVAIAAVLTAVANVLAVVAVFLV